MKRILVGIVVTAIVMGAMVLAEEAAINPIRVTTRQINAYGPNPIQIMGTNVTATAAELNIMDGVTVSASQINAAGGGTTAALTPTTVTASGKTTANGELEANDIVDINLSTTNHLITVDQTNTVGKADVPLVKIVDARTGANANTAGEATLVITPAGTHAVSVTAGISALQAVTATTVTGSGLGDFASLTSTGAVTLGTHVFVYRVYTNMIYDGGATTGNVNIVSW
jgi:hypothetical protein